MKVSVIQMSSRADLADNLADAEKWLGIAREEAAELVVLPENFSCLGGDLTRLGQEEEQSSVVRDFLSGQARRLGIWIIGGTTPCHKGGYGQDSDKRPQASCFVMDPDGCQRARYDKMHLFDVDVKDKQGVYRESDTYRYGSELTTVQTSAGLTGLSICYDLRFPELFRALSAQGVEIICLPAAFTRITGAAHWEVLLRARAIENQCYILAANQCGIHGQGRETWGHSMIIEPWGEVVAEADDTPGVITAELDMARLTEIRSQMPCLSHRRL